jgi:hypothetical protein
MSCYSATSIILFGFEHILQKNIQPLGFVVVQSLKRDFWKDGLSVDAPFGDVTVSFGKIVVKDVVLGENLVVHQSFLVPLVGFIEALFMVTVRLGGTQQFT